jgi:hypothetical protein
LGPPSTIQNSPALPCRIALRRTTFDSGHELGVSQGLAIKPAEPAADPLGDPAVAVAVDRHLVRLRARVGQFVFDHDVVARLRRNERARQAAERIGLGPGAAGPGAVVGREIGQHHLFLVVGERLRQRRALGIELHGAEHLLPTRLIAARSDDPLGVVAELAFRLDDGPALAGG